MTCWIWRLVSDLPLARPVVAGDNNVLRVIVRMGFPGTTARAVKTPKCTCRWPCCRSGKALLEFCNRIYLPGPAVIVCFTHTYGYAYMYKNIFESQLSCVSRLRRHVDRQRSNLKSPASYARASGHAFARTNAHLRHLQ